MGCPLPARVKRGGRNGLSPQGLGVGRGDVRGKEKEDEEWRRRGVFAKVRGIVRKLRIGGMRQGEPLKKAEKVD